MTPAVAVSAGIVAITHDGSISSRNWDASGRAWRELGKEQGLYNKVSSKL